MALQTSGIVMRIDEKDLAKARDAEGLCHLRRNVGGFKFADYQLLLAKAKIALQQPALFGDRHVTPSHTSRYFAEEWETTHRGHRAIPVLAFPSVVPLLPDTWVWLALEHQTSGYACRQNSMIATRLPPYAAIQTAFDQIAKEFHFACGGYFTNADSNPEMTCQYLEAVQAPGLSCDASTVQHLCEGMYPVDANATTLPMITDHCRDLLPLVEGDGPRPVVLFLAENSD